MGKVTKLRRKIKNRPKTVIEKLERLKEINPELENLIKEFDLEVSL